MRVGYFGPEGTFTQEALRAAVGEGSSGQPSGGLELLALPTIFDTVMAVQSGQVERALVPIENSLEGSVNATLDALVIETEDVAIVGEIVHPIHHCLIARTRLELGEIETVVSHPQATAQCARFLRTEVPQAQVLAGTSTAEAVRMVAQQAGRWAALGPRLAAELYNCQVLRAGVEDVPDNETRFVWLARAGTQPGWPADRQPPRGPWKTAIVFWDPGADSPGWLVSCLQEFASRQVNLTRIESRPRKQGLGLYMFFLDLEGRDTEPTVREALAALGEQVEVLRMLGSFPAA